ncbi:hypothetical protein HSX11_23790 [Oxalobacteraceae bacterium]|nr:hypothetical protein [Oxalobacteraceae bacterium]
MKRTLLLLLSCSVLVSACSSSATKQKEAAAADARVLAAKRKPVQPTVNSDGTRRVGINGVDIVKVEFNPGISSATVENLAKQQGCTGGVGAGLMTPAGPVEVYRMACENGKVFMARCELRQCKPMQ